MKKLTVIFLIILFALFYAYLKIKQTEYKVLQVVSPTEIIVDLNGNELPDSNEHITLNVVSFSYKDLNSEVYKHLNISHEDYISLAYLAEKYANKFFISKHVDFIGNKLYVNGQNYEDCLLKNGLALKPDEKINSKALDNIKNAKKLNLVILNKKSNIYHKLNCKYGLHTGNFEILPLSNVVKHCHPCHFCFKKDSYKALKTLNKNSIKAPPLNFYSNNISIFITDFINKKPDNSCKTPACRALVKEINSANNSIDIAIYGYTKVPTLEKALKNAIKRGVNIRLVFDTNRGENIYPDTFKLTEILKYNNSDVIPAIMHNKFFIFDKQKVYTGSANISNTDMSAFNSNVSVLINSKEIAEAFSNEFEQMYLGKFHKHKHLIEKAPVYIDNSEISYYFSPRDNIIKIYILPLISNAKNYIYIPAFLLSHYAMSEALIKAKKRGVDVKIILDATNVHKASSSRIKDLREANIPVKTEIFAGKLHSKSILIDDEYTILGSMNFSKSGESINDENVLIIKNAEITKFYKRYFLYLWNKIPDVWLKWFAKAESTDSIGSCSDGIDNDFDGKIDKLDNGCWFKSVHKSGKK